MAGSRGPLGKGGFQAQYGDVPDVPKANPSWLPSICADWDAFWSSDVARAVTPSDMAMVYRLFEYRNDLIEIRIRRFRQGPLDGNEERTEVVRMKDLETMILKLEDRVGASPLARARLGIEVGNARLTWEQVNKLESADEPNSGLPVGKIIDV